MTASDNYRKAGTIHIKDGNEKRTLDGKLRASVIYFENKKFNSCFTLIQAEDWEGNPFLQLIKLKCKYEIENFDKEVIISEMTNLFIKYSNELEKSPDFTGELSRWNDVILSSNLKKWAREVILDNSKQKGNIKHQIKFC